MNNLRTKPPLNEPYTTTVNVTMKNIDENRERGDYTTPRIMKALLDVFENPRGAGEIAC